MMKLLSYSNWIKKTSSNAFKKAKYINLSKGNHHHVYIMDSNWENVKQLTFSNYSYSPFFIPNKIKILK